MKPLANIFKADCSEILPNTKNLSADRQRNTNKGSGLKFNELHSTWIALVMLLRE